MPKDSEGPSIAYGIGSWLKYQDSRGNMSIVADMQCLPNPGAYVHAISSMHIGEDSFTAEDMIALKHLKLHSKLKKASDTWSPL